MKLNHATGQAAEEQALNFLLKQGCTLVARNWHCRYGEIDLIMRLGEMLLFVEVKYRKNQRFGGASYSITPQKLLKLNKAIEYYLHINALSTACRLDAILIEGDNPPIWLENLTG